MNQKKKALITGITGQDGSYLAELCWKTEYSFHALVEEMVREDDALVKKE